MNPLEKLILNLKKNTIRDNYYLLRRRISKGNGKRSIGWILKRDDTDKSIEGFDVQELISLRKELKNNERD